MTTDRLRSRRWPTIVGLLAVSGLLGLFFGGCKTGLASLRGGLSRDQIEQLPPEAAKAYELFAVRCSRCHTLSRPLGANIYEHRHWDSYVHRMRRHPGSGISVKDAETILVFLYHYADQKAVQAGIRTPPQAPKDDVPTEEASP